MKSDALRLAKRINMTPPAAIIDDSAVTVAEVDTLGYDYLAIIVMLGATDIAISPLKVTESDATGSGHVDVTGLVFGTSVDVDGSTSAEPTATDDNGLFIFNINLVGRKRFIDVSMTVGNGSAGGYVAILGELTQKDTAVVSVAGLGAAGALEV